MHSYRRGNNGKIAYLFPVCMLQRSSLTVVGGVVKQWFWLPLLLGGLGALVYYYIRRRQSSRFSKLFE